MEIGYKQTEIGLIPSDWEGYLLGNTFQFKQGVQCPVEKQKSQQENGLRRFVRIIDLTQPKELPRFIDDPGASHHIHKHDLFMVRYGSPGLLGFGFEGVIANNLFRLIPKLKIESTYFYYLLSYKNREILNLSSSTTMAALNFVALRELKVVFPPTLTEQTAIATALSDADGLITSLEKLIAKKRNIKQGAMQELLRPKEGWVVKRLGEIGKVYGGLSGKSKENFQNGTYPYIPFMNIMSNPVIDPDYLDFVSIGVSENQNIALKGDLFFNGSSETPAEVGMCSLLEDKIPNLYLNSFCFGFRLFKEKSIDGLFLTYFFRSGEGRSLIFSLAQGATRYNLSKHNFLNLEIPIPSSSEEQTRIATILSDMDSELSTLEKKLEKAKHLKQGMMQQLLTGKIRLV